ncbi:MAG TPA: transglycosylase SLT domain-containing protein [Gemmatimonadaceae bacterium]|nr:transglycosylase SLT domain-containing protein [Gemmatimonadaceae bacterium]
MRRLLFCLFVSAASCSQPAAREMSEGALDAPATGDSILINAAAALQNGQPWRAAQILEPVLRDSTQRTPERVLLAARAAAEWGGWGQVDRLLGKESWLDSRFDGLGRELLARAATARREDTLVLRHAELAVNQASNSRERGTRVVLLARALDRMDSLARAASAYVEAARLLPEAGDWLRLRAAAVTADSAARTAHYVALQTDVARARVSWVEAQARERTSDLAGAVAAYEALGARMSVLRLRLAAAATAGDSAARDTIRRELFRIVTSSRGSTNARLAVELIDGSLTPLTADEELAIARSAAVSGPAARALDGFARAFKAGRGTPNDRYTYASTLANAGRYREAAAQFARVPASSRLAARAAYERARGLLRDGQGTRASTALQAIVTRFVSDTSAASSALYLLGDLAADDGRDDDARGFFRRAATKYPSAALGPSARFRAAILAFVKEDYRTAALELDTLALHRPRSSETLSGLYWSGRAWDSAGDSATAHARWAEVITREPGSYYAMLAARRLRREPWAPSAGTDTIAVDSAMLAALQRAELLRQLGMDSEAQLEHDWVASQAERSVEATLAAAHAFRQRDLAPRAIRLGNKALSSGAARDERLYEVLYPLAFKGALTREAERHRLDPALVAALIRQESNFEPRATSRAGARGLMQIMPAVGRQLASAEDYHMWDVELLYQPDVSLELGTTHLAGLLSGYAHVSHALAAYNAGSSRAKRWLEKPGTADPEVFVERIPFRETRDYVRIILRNRELYRSMYGA